MIKKESMKKWFEEKEIKPGGFCANMIADVIRPNRETNKRLAINKANQFGIKQCPCSFAFIRNCLNNWDGLNFSY